jgi:hypothetical protein
MIILLLLPLESKFVDAFSVGKTLSERAKERFYRKITKSFRNSFLKLI